MKRLFLLCALLMAALPACAETNGHRAGEEDSSSLREFRVKTAIFAGGCFWCIEADFEKLNGVIAVESGYTGGTLKHPTYQQVSAGGTGHAEAVRVQYDPQQVSYEKLLDYFWHHIDPTVKNQQFCDLGSQYRSAIFYQDKVEQALATASKQALQSRFANIYTEIVAASTFYPAEIYHQDYYRKNPLRYQYYRYRCGRNERVKAVWGTR